jgi:hypothetical protein
VSGLDAGGRVPDLDLVNGEGPTRLSGLLRSGRGVLLDPSGATVWPSGWAGRVDLVHAKAEEEFEPMLIRPDGTVCWQGDGPVADALTCWFGQPV